MLHLTGCLPLAGGVDDQPAARLTRMVFAGRLRAFVGRKQASDNWAADMSAADRALAALLAGVGEELDSKT